MNIAGIRKALNGRQIEVCGAVYQLTDIGDLETVRLADEDIVVVYDDILFSPMCFFLKRDLDSLLKGENIRGYGINGANILVKGNEIKNKDNEQSSRSSRRNARH